MSRLNLKNRNQTGFTMIEVIAVLVVISIISVVLATRLMSTDSQLIASTDVIKTHLRYAQSRAMSSDVVWGIVFQGSTYSLFRNGDTTDKVFLPGEDSDDLNLPPGKTATETVAFDSWGKPYNDAQARSGVDDRSTGQIGNLSVVVTQNTGFIE